MCGAVCLLLVRVVHFNNKLYLLFEIVSDVSLISFSFVGVVAAEYQSLLYCRSESVTFDTILIF